MSSIAMRGALKGALVVCVLAAFWNGACNPSESVQPPAGIALSTASVAFADTAGLANPPAQAVSITADGQTKLSGLRASVVSYSGGADGWLTATLSDTAAPATLTLAANMAGLNPADYQATVAVSAGSAANSPQNITVSFKVMKPVPKIGVSASSVAFADTQFSGEPEPKTLSITADGHGALTGLKASVTYGSGAPGWLTATLSDTTAPATLRLTAKLAGLNPANYSATIGISASSAQNTPVTVPVTFNVATAPPINGVTVVALGNLGSCGGELGRESAKVVAAANPDYVLMVGNSVQTSHVSTLQDYMNCYDPVWGQFKSKTYAALGSSEVDIDTIPPTYGTGLASGADAYFGPDRIGPAGKNWYSFDLGSWHVIALNAQSPGGYKRPVQIQFNASSEQFWWLGEDLKAHKNKCTLAFWYQAMWMSSTKIDPDWLTPKDGYRIQDIRGIWVQLYDNNADLVINGTPHIYERFAPMKYDSTYKYPSKTEWKADSVRGIAQITTGLGGDGPTHADSAVVRLPVSVYRSGGNGVVKLVLGDGVYSWEFLNTKYSHIQDAGRGKCH